MPAGAFPDTNEATDTMPHLTLEYSANLDGFDAGATLRALNAVLAASGHFDELDIKSRALQAGDAGRAAAILERMLLIAPEAGGLWHELGLVRARLGAIKGAVEALERGLACPLPEAARSRVEAALAQLTASLH